MYMSLAIVQPMLAASYILHLIATASNTEYHLQALQFVQEDCPLQNGHSALQCLRLHFPVPRILAQSCDRTQVVHAFDPELVENRGNVQQRRIARGEDDLHRRRRRRPQHGPSLGVFAERAGALLVYRGARFRAMPVSFRQRSWASRASLAASERRGLRVGDHILSRGCISNGPS